MHKLETMETSLSDVLYYGNQVAEKTIRKDIYRSYALQPSYWHG